MPTADEFELLLMTLETPKHNPPAR